MFARIFSKHLRKFKRIFSIDNCSCIVIDHGKDVHATYKRNFGQPVASTHPHLLREGEVIPGITKDEFRRRRELLMERIVKSYKGDNSVKSHLILIPSASRAFMSDKIMYPFRQNTDFLYYSGFLESDSLLLLFNKPGKSVVESVLFVPERTPDKENWEVPKSGPEGAIEVTGVENAFKSTELEAFVERYCKHNSKFALWCDLGLLSDDLKYKELINEIKAKGSHSVHTNLNKDMQSMRVVKSEAEIKVMERSVKIASEAMIDVIRFSGPNMNESDLYAKMEFECRIRGAQFLAYIPVVAGGNRANVIHYTSNNQLLQSGDLVLMDAGCDHNGYSSDLTRTWPVSGKFSPAQREIYDIVLRVQKVCISKATVDHSIQDLFYIMLQEIGLGLQSAGIIPSHVINLKMEAFKFCPHNISHHLGMDLHDCPTVEKSEKLQPGMIITVEPGIYITKDNLNVEEKYRGIGIRIEDDVLITTQGPKILSSMLPSDPDEIEALMAERY